MSINRIITEIASRFRGIFSNAISLGNGSTLEKDYKVLKVGEASTQIEMSKSKVRINNLDTNSLTVKGASVQTLVPFIKTSQFQDDIGTTQHYIPFNNLTEQSSSGTENLGFIAPYNMKLQKVAIKCSEDISGATLEVGFWAIDDGSATNHHAAANQQNVDVTGGAAHTNAIADFTNVVNDGTGSGGGSNAITAGQFVDLSIQADSDQTSSSAEFWITCYFLADLTATI